MGYEHLLLFGVVCVATGFLVIFFWPRMLLYVYRRAILVQGFGDGPIPINTLYTEPQELFAEPITSQTASGSNAVMAGMNRERSTSSAGSISQKDRLSCTCRT